MGFFSKLFGGKVEKKGTETVFEARNATKDEVKEVEQNTVEFQGDYAKTIFLNAMKKPSPIKKADEYARYFLHECGIADASRYHKKMVDEGYLEKAPLEDSLKALKVAELKEILSELNLPATGKKEELIERIIENYDEVVIKRHIKEVLYSISEKGEAFLKEHEDYIKLHEHKKWGVDWKEFDANKKSGYSFNDIMWGIFNSRIINSKNYGRSEYYCMYELLCEEGKRKRALETLLRVIYIDLCCVDILKYADLYRDEIFTLEELKDSFNSAMIIAPGLFSAVKEYADIYDEAMVDRIYEWHLPVRVCGKFLFLEIVRSLIDGTYNEEAVEKKLRLAYESKVDELIR